MSELHKANWWTKSKDNKVICNLCPRYCKLGDGQKGFCFTRENINGLLYSTGYGRPTGFAIDPIEKKPLFHFYPGEDILSFGTAGCNLGCKFCQNWHTSKARIDETDSLNVTPDYVIEIAKKYNIGMIAFTYNEPTIVGEFVIDVAKLAKQEYIKTVMVTAGYITKEARSDIYKYIDAANVDLKAFTEEFYFKYTSAHLSFVLDTLKWLKNETNVWIELTNLLIPNLNDSTEETKELCNWVLTNLGDTTPLHFTAFHPTFKLVKLQRTPPKTVINAREIALKEGLKYSYVGNIVYPEGETTLCPSCGEELIVRDWHSISKNRIENGKCSKCKTQIAGWFF